MKRAIALLLLLLPVTAFCQITYQPGYFIENGKKTECLIRNYAWKNNPVSIEYKTSEDGETKTKTIKEISEFNVDAYKYKRFNLNIDRSGVTLEQLSNSKEAEWKSETLLLKILVEGKANLYQYENGNVIKYFFSTGDHSKAEQLLYKEYRKEGRVAENNIFRQQLYNLMKDSGKAMGKFANVRYKKDALVELFTEYNGSNGLDVVNHTEKQNKSSVNIKVTAGASLSSVNIKNNMSGDYYDFGTNVSYRIGAEFEYIMPFNNNKWSLFAEPNYQTFDKSGNKGTMKMDADYKYIEIPVGFRHYMFLNPKAKLFISGAYVMALPMGDGYVQYSGSRLEIENNSAFAAGAGFTYNNKYSIEIRHNFTHGVINYPVWEAGYNTTALILAYKVF